MVGWALLIQLMHCFPGSYINADGEFIAREQGNQYFKLASCNTALDIQCSVLAYLSRGACKTQVYMNEAKNREFHKFMRDGINMFLGTDFSEDDMYTIYTYFGNGIRRDKAIEFIRSGYDMSFFAQFTEER